MGAPGKQTSFLHSASILVLILALPSVGTAGSTRPYYQRHLPAPQNAANFNVDRVDLAKAHLPPYATPDGLGVMPDSIPSANSLFDARAAAMVSAGVGNPFQVRISPVDETFDPAALLEVKDYGGIAPTISVVTPKCMAVMAYADYFSDTPFIGFRSMVSEAIMEASPGWCGSFGPGHTGTLSLDGGYEGNYDMNEMHLIPLVYAFYDELDPLARERVINLLLNLGRIQRPNESDTFTSGAAPNDWSRAGYISPLGIEHDVVETENHVLMIATARYLTNQLLYQRLHDAVHDNRRNGDPAHGVTDCTEILLSLLQNMLRDDFAEYNAKNYQEETRWALNNLCSYAYDDDVRLGARMVLDYISAHFAVSSDDLRRSVPFRRRDEEPNSHRLSTDPSSPDFGFMDVGLLEHGNDPMAPYFALLAGNTRAYEKANYRIWPGDTNPARGWDWAMKPAPEYTQEVLSDYRLPTSIHDLLINDSHRRFFQRLHRIPHDDPGGQRNCDNLEIYSGSPSYLITAGGSPATWIIPGFAGFGYQTQNLGVAVPTSFMPTGLSAGLNSDGSSRQNDTPDLIQFSRFSDLTIDGGSPGGTENYGVAPDFACGYKLHLPKWVTDVAQAEGRFLFVNKWSGGTPNGRIERAGFFLAIHIDGNFALLEAFDTWLHPEVSYAQFKARVAAANPTILINENQETTYATQNGNRIHFVIWNNTERDNYQVGSTILNVEYGAGNPADTLVNAGNNAAPFLSGTILNSPSDAVVEIINPSLGTKITLDMSDYLHPKRTSESGVVQRAGWDLHEEVWVDFTSPVGLEAGDFGAPFKTLAAAVSTVAIGGTVNITPGAKSEPMTISKPMTLKSFPGSAVLGHN